jgi:phosphoserine phosphatase
MAQMLSRAVVLTAAPGSRAIDEATIAAVREALVGESAVSETWLAPSEAWECRIVRPEGDSCAPLRGRLSQVLAARPIDVNIVPDDPAVRRKKLLIADMDSTMIEQECIDEMADVMGIKPLIAAITERTMRGELDFEAALTERLALLAGIEAAKLEWVWRERVVLMPGGATLVATMQRNGAFAALVSGGFTFFTARVAAAVGFDVHRANALGIEDGRMTGRVVGPILGREAKLAALQEFATARGLHSAATLAVGDGANDLAMIRAAGLGVAYRAKPLVAAEAHAAITHGDLTALLHLQGYRRDEFASAA